MPRFAVVIVNAGNDVMLDIVEADNCRDAVAAHWYVSNNEPLPNDWSGIVHHFFCHNELVEAKEIPDES